MTCRQRAWEQRRAAASGRAAIEVVERVIQVPVATTRLPTHGEWATLLRELAVQLDAGRIYQRDCDDLGEALNAVVLAWTRRR